MKASPKKPRRSSISGVVAKVQPGRFLTHTPVLGRGVFVAPGARLIGAVAIGEGSSVWYNAVLRADLNRIVVGEDSNVQDNAVLHLADDYDCQVGDRTTIGHAAVVHACRIMDEVLVGMGAVILDGAVIAAQSIIGAGTLVPQHFCVPEGKLVLGRPGRVVRALTRSERADLKRLARKYVQLAREYRRRGLDRMAEPAS